MPDIDLPYFFSRPAADPPWPGVVVIHEGNGISPQLLRFCQRLAAAGYGAIAPDLFFRAGGTEAADFATLIGSLEPERTQGDIDHAAALLRSMGADKVGVTGFCMGGRLTYHTAVWGNGFDAAVGFYGAGIADELAEPAVSHAALLRGERRLHPHRSDRAGPGPSPGHRCLPRRRARVLP